MNTNSTLFTDKSAPKKTRELTLEEALNKNVVSDVKIKGPVMPPTANLRRIPSPYKKKLLFYNNNQEGGSGPNSVERSSNLNSDRKFPMIRPSTQAVDDYRQGVSSRPRKGCGSIKK